ncbi:MAG TPA: hypothetical protein VMZ91_15990, partial [Candidatus Paceibacterota bacterium]|nr:hypothetical protein [Candidatus Paceibacterota bacterium]
MVEKKQIEDIEEEVEEAETKPKQISKKAPIIVVKELPMQPTNVGTITETGEQVELITIEDAITEMYSDIKKIVKAVA